MLTIITTCQYNVICMNSYWTWYLQCISTVWFSNFLSLLLSYRYIKILENGMVMNNLINFFMTYIAVLEFVIINMLKAYPPLLYKHIWCKMSRVFQSKVDVLCLKAPWNEHLIFMAKRQVSTYFKERKLCTYKSL